MLEVKSLACIRGEAAVFADISFTLSPGEVLFVRGANGSGKSSLLRLLAGLLAPAGGEILWHDTALENDGQVAWLGHQDGLKSSETVLEAVRFRAALYGSNAPVADALAAFNLTELADTQIRYLSAGQKRRVALAAVLATGARLWLLDEPVTALDAASVALFRTALDRHLAAGGLAVITTHDEGDGVGGRVLELGVKNPSPQPSPIGRGSKSAPRLLPLCGWERESSEARRVRGASFLTPTHRDVRLAARHSGQVLTGLLFFVLVIVMLAFGVGPDPALQQKLAAGAVWVAALLAALLSLERLFAADHDDGTLDQLLASPLSAEAIAFGKMLAHWLTTGLPLALVSPVGGLLLHLPWAAIGAMVAAFLLGGPVLSLLGGAVAALLVGARRSGVLIALLTLPLYAPVLIFGAAAIEKTLAGGSAAGPLLFLAALLALALPLAPLAAAAALQENH